MGEHMKMYQLGPQVRSHGNWYVEVEGEWLPVGHHWWLRDHPRYIDPSDGRPSMKWRQWIKDVQAKGRMVIQISQFDQEGKVRSSGRYAGLFTVTDVELSKNGVFTCNVEKIAEVSW